MGRSGAREVEADPQVVEDGGLLGVHVEPSWSWSSVDGPGSLTLSGMNFDHPDRRMTG